MRGLTAGLERTIHALAVGALALGCAPTVHTVARYRLDRDEALALEARAGQICEDTEGTVELPKHPFVTDGCTFGVDAWGSSSWQECCVEHDISYWCGGPSSMRSAADKRLRECVAEESSGFLGATFWLGTRVGGHRLVPAHWRWGYGHEYPASR